MQIWVDADACPVVIKDMLFRLANKREINVVLVANQYLSVPSSRFIRTIQVPSGFDVADDKIAESVEPGDLVITSDVPLASDVIEKGGHALTPRGELFTKDNIRQRLTMRDFMDELRGSGVQTGGPPAMTQRDRKNFADELDRFVTRFPAN